MICVSPLGIHISLVICVWGYTYHGDTHITVTAVITRVKVWTHQKCKLRSMIIIVQKSNKNNMFITPNHIQANTIPCFISKKSKFQISTSCSTGLICICGPDKFHLLSTENVTYTFRDFGMFHTNEN